jgi:XTP/dITP diphosphohydrolase
VSLPLPLVLATQNGNKAREIVEIFVTVSGEPLVAYAVDDIAFLVDTPERIAASAAALPAIAEPPDVTETGATFEANARIKAEALRDAFGLLTLADDSGLEVDALNGAPGVRSARFAGEGATDAENVTLLLERLNALDGGRSANFACVALASGPAGEVVERGRVDGTIDTVPRGANGFGYDPVFVPVEGDGRTFAEMTPDEKHAISHRGRAFRALAAALDEMGQR